MAEEPRQGPTPSQVSVPTQSSRDDIDTMVATGSTVTSTGYMVAMGTADGTKETPQVTLCMVAIEIPTVKLNFPRNGFLLA